MDLTESQKKGVLRHLVDCLNMRTCQRCENVERDIEAKFCKNCGNRFDEKGKWILTNEE